MNEIFQKAIKDSQLLRKTEVPWKLDEPFEQPCNAFDATASSWASKIPASQSVPHAEIADIALYTWNIDFMLSFGEARMKAALNHLQGRLEELARKRPSIAPVIFLQECTPQDLFTISSNSWVRKHFVLADIDATHWATTHYGTTMLLDARLPITSVFRVHYSQTRMDRDALFADVSLGPKKLLRLCNTHLESLLPDPPLRPAQIALVSAYLHKSDVHAAAAAGDFNAIQPQDRSLHSETNLKDAFLEQGGREDTEEGYTWGQQAPTKLREQFGCSRMDKVFFCGALKLREFGRFGADVELDGEEEGRGIVELGIERPWITDHLGVWAEFEIGGG